MIKKKGRWEHKSAASHSAANNPANCSACSARKAVTDVQVFGCAFKYFAMCGVSKQGVLHLGGGPSGAMQSGRSPWHNLDVL